MKNPSKRYLHLFIALGSVVVYAVIFPILYPTAGIATAALIVIPMVITGWLVGVIGSLVFGILALPLNAFLFDLVGDTATAKNLAAAQLSQSAFILIGIGAGWIKGLIDRVNQHRHCPEPA
jgi:hypothetical protein